ncbi:rust resistance kinase Lr10-like [Senna tora]|uniref:Rust resistance kinase Lr10-like n=1 Tax=Senna tora TaxID=362788 RepID=A0A834TY20_9FABA|nr:rust resistance kinase Lr10-like [Senna tora]
MKSEDQARVETFLKDYKALKPTRFSYADLKRITNNFKEKLGEGAHGTVFKGNISNEIVVAVKILNSLEDDGKEFINEVGTMGRIHHINVVRLLGFCADGFHRALVYDFFPNGSLQNFISHPDNNGGLFLGWEKLQQIAIGIAKGIEYLHLGCDQRIIHFDINPHNVLLDHDFTPKISDFGLAKLYPKNQSIVSMTSARGTLGYIAPEVFSRNFGNVSYKSDIYSYGMMLVEIVGGRKNTNADEESFQILYPDWIHSLIEGRDIHIHIEDEEDIKMAKKLAIVGLWCIQWHPVDRPSIKAVIQMLEGEVEQLKVPPSPFDSTSSTNISATIPTRHLNFELEHLYCYIRPTPKLSFVNRAEASFAQLHFETTGHLLDFTIRVAYGVKIKSTVVNITPSNTRNSKSDAKRYRPMVSSGQKSTGEVGRVITVYIPVW